MGSEAKLQTKLLDPFADIQQVHRSRPLQAFDQVTGKCEAVSTEIDELPSSPEFKTLDALSKIDALGNIDVAGLRDEVASHKSGLFESTLDRNGVERALKDRPLPEGCPLHVDEAATLVSAAESALEAAQAAVKAALVNVAKLLMQPALRSLLEQGKSESFIADVLAAADAEKLAELLVQRIPADPAKGKLLAKYLKRIIVKVVQLQDFRPSKATVGKSDIDAVVTEFRQFLEDAVGGDGKDQSTILEIK